MSQTQFLTTATRVLYNRDGCLSKICRKQGKENKFEQKFTCKLLAEVRLLGGVCCCMRLVSSVRDRETGHLVRGVRKVSRYVVINNIAIRWACPSFLRRRRCSYPSNVVVKHESLVNPVRYDNRLIPAPGPTGNYCQNWWLNQCTTLVPITCSHY